MAINPEENYKEINKASWNKRTEIHYHSEFYDNKSFIKGKSSLNSIELELLGNVSGKSILHLQCHFGQDTISLARLGANCTGIDISNIAIEKAHELSKITNTEVEFICCDLYDLPNHLNKKYDIVFSSYGTIGWLPDIDNWAKIISQFLKPKGNFVFAEFHPFVWMLDDDFTHIKYRYFNDGPIVENEVNTYAERSAELDMQSVCWNHSLSEVINALILNGLEIQSFSEFDYSPYDCFAKTEEFEPGKFRIKPFKNKIPMVYAILAAKK